MIQWETTTDAAPGELLARRVSRRRSVRQPRRVTTDPYAVTTSILLRGVAMLLTCLSLAQIRHVAAGQSIDPDAGMPVWAGLVVISLPAALGAIVAWRAADNCEFPPAVGEERTK